MHDWLLYDAISCSNFLAALIAQVLKVLIAKPLGCHAAKLLLQVSQHLATSGPSDFFTAWHSL